MIILIDNYDSFTYNLYQYLGEFGEDVQVIRNDQITISAIEKLNPTSIVLSPGPGYPKDAGICLEVIKYFAPLQKPILGICLGCQAIGEAFGGKIIHAPKIFHGKTSIIDHNHQGIFKNSADQIEVGRYHSLIIERESLPECFEISAWTDDNIIMAIHHRNYPLVGIQFHPESVLTPDGKQLLRCFIENYSSSPSSPIALTGHDSTAS